MYDQHLYFYIIKINRYPTMLLKVVQIVDIKNKIVTKVLILEM